MCRRNLKERPIYFITPHSSKLIEIILSVVKEISNCNVFFIVQSYYIITI